jgi:hypothetical protein
LKLLSDAIEIQEDEAETEDDDAVLGKRPLEVDSSAQSVKRQKIRNGSHDSSDWKHASDSADEESALGVVSDLNTRETTRGGNTVRGGSRKDKGLRHFSLKVCQKLAEKQSTTYAQVAEELVRELTVTPEGQQQYAEKNIRRRVYDALNVLYAIGAIQKTLDRRVVSWKGLPEAPVRSL